MVPVSTVASRTTSTRLLALNLAAPHWPSGWRTRFAPAPTGFLHLGHVVNALFVWGIARAHGGQVVLRVEDHDRSRSRPEFERALLDDLDWLGFIPDIGTTEEFRAGNHALRQSDNAARYERHLEYLSSRSLEYGCICTRKDIADAVGDHAGDEIPYPGTCEHGRHLAAIARRFRVSDSSESFDDLRLGAQQQVPKMQCGDFLVRDRNGNYTYQFCVAVDDFEDHIDLVIRGEDLRPSTGRQLQLARVLGRPSPAQFLHHPLLLRADGLKLSKSLGDTGVREMRDAGITSEAVLGHAAFACGLIEQNVPLDHDEVTRLFV